MPGDSTLRPPAAGDDWLGLSDVALPAHEAADWVARPDCGGIVSFVGLARDHSVGRPSVHTLVYEAYAEQVEPRLALVANAARASWPTVGRIAMLHRVGALEVGDAAVVVAVSAPHRDEAFAAARYCIDTLKESVPIWKKEAWDGGESWGLEAQHLTDPTPAADCDSPTGSDAPPPHHQPMSMGGNP